ncbi:unnamed protein product [Microthlaspi erraticum]|uniref:Uncharacterized protein n=1 Tax=Microthlaspi erraticum TaxID=1685480 RepID=A0A6D2J7Y9_9BRAS|nr:unnamed protein product [Microthlaspi erraticum]
MQKRQCPESVSSAEDGFSRFEEKMKVLFEDGFGKLSAAMKSGFEQSDSKFTILTRKVIRIEKTVQSMQAASRRPNTEPVEPDAIMRRTSRLLKMVEPRRRLRRSCCFGEG